MIYKQPDVITILTKYFPDTEFVVRGEATYYNIEFLTAPVSMVAMDIKMLPCAKLLAEAEVKQQATFARQRATQLVLQTVDVEQIRTYEEKYAEASTYLANTLSPTPLLDAELVFVSETKPQLANDVVAQYNAAKNILRGMYGTIEGKRRSQIAAVYACTNLAQINSLPEIAWGV
jgi:Tfp pilus assembly protein PilV